MTIITSVNIVPGLNAEIKVTDFNTAELLAEVVKQLKIASMKLDCLQPDGDVIDDNELDSLELQ